MALPLIPLLLGGLFAGDKFKRGRDSKARTVERDRLKEGMLAALGTEPSLFEGEARPGGEQLQGQFGGTGLLADPNNQANQLQFGADLFGLTGGSGFGQSIIEQSLGFGQRNTEQAALFQQQDNSQDNLFTFNREENRMDREQQLTIAEDRAEALRVNNEQKAQALQLTQGPAGFGSQASGTRRVELDDGSFADVPLRDTPRYTDAVTELQTFERAVTDIDAMITSIETHGSEYIGVEAGQQALAYGQILAHMAQLRELGVLQKSDIEFMEAALTDPSTITGMHTSSERMIESYKTAQRFFQDKLRESNQKYALWGIGSDFESTTPRQQEQLAADQALTESAAGLGLTRTGRLPPVSAAQPSRKRSGGLLGRGGTRGN